MTEHDSTAASSPTAGVTGNKTNSIQVYFSEDVNANDAAAVAIHLHWPETKVQAAFNYASEYPKEIEAALGENDAMDFESLRRMLPQAGQFFARVRAGKR